MALHSLIYFYKGTHDLLKPIHPVGKFLTIKAIVFFAFWWVFQLLGLVFASHPVTVHVYREACVIIFFLMCRQSVLIAVLVKVGALPESWKSYDVEDVSLGLQVCVTITT